MQYRVLGPLEVDAGDGPVPLGGPKQRAILAALVMRANEVVPAESLIDAVWGEDPPGQARNTLQTYISNLRKSLGADALVGRSPGYVLVVDPLDIDATRFDALLRDARKSLPVDPRVALQTLDDALSMWRGPALADVAEERSLLAEAARLDELRLEAQEERIDALLDVGMADRAIGELEPLVAHHPLREGLWQQLMLALYRAGRQAEALGAFQRAREILADELGIDPSPELARLHARVLSQDPSLDLRGEPLRGFRLLEQVGEGWTGVRFRAIQPGVGRDVEIEVIHEHVASAASFVERFEPEAGAIAALEHPHIVPVYDSWREPGRAYVVRRFMPGATLATTLARNEPLDPLPMVAEIAAAIAFAHRRGVTHGEIGADAIVFDREGNAYLGGFAIGAGPRRGERDDVRALAELAADLVGDDAPPALSRVIERCRTGDVPAADVLADAARAALAGSAAPPSATTADDVRNPYRGLRPFAETDAHDFFGRTAAIDAVLDAFTADHGARFIAVVGPSGCGKSSLVRAGVVPRLRGGASGTFVTELTPGAHPFDALEVAIADVAILAVPRAADALHASSRGLMEVAERAVPGDARIVIVLDQLEELFTLATSSQEREAFLESIRVACVDPSSRIAVIATLRADFYDRPLLSPRFGELLAEHTFALPPLQPDELEQAIRNPAERIGVAVEPGLVADIVADAVHEPGTLPLVQFALTELFDGRRDGRMTAAGYRELGGVVGSVSASADAEIERARPDDRGAIRQLFLRLVTLGEGRADTRRRVARSELHALATDPDAIDRILDAFGRLRVLTFDRDPVSREPTIEIAHEALLSSWGTLRGWIDEARDDLRLEVSLARAAAEWSAADEDPSFLLRGPRLDHAAEWLGATALAVTHEVRRFVRAAIAAQRDQEAELSRRRAREQAVERRAARRLRALVAVFAVAAVVAASLTVVATSQSDRAERQSAISDARRLASASLSVLGEDPELSVLLAIEAVELARALDDEARRQAEEALHRAIAASRTIATFPGLGGRVATADGGLMAALRLDRPGAVTVVRGSRELRTIAAHDGAVVDVALSADGTLLVTSGEDGRVRAWDPVNGSMLWTRRGDVPAGTVSVDRTGSRLVAAWPKAGELSVLDAMSGRPIRRLSCVPGDGECLVSISPGGTQVAIASVIVTRDGIATGEVVPIDGGPGTRFSAPPFVGINGAPEIDPASTLVSGSSFVWDASSGELVHVAEHGDLVTSSDWAPDGRRLVTGAGSTAQLWDVSEAVFAPTLELSAGRGGAVTDVAFTPDGDHVVTASDALRVWDVSPVGDAEIAGVEAPTIYSGGLAFLHDGARLVVLSDNVVAALSSWTVGDAALDPWLPGSWCDEPIGPDRICLPTAPISANPIDGSIVAVSGRSAAIVSGDRARRLPFATSRAVWTPDGNHLITEATGGLAVRTIEGAIVRRIRTDLPIEIINVSHDGLIAIAPGDLDPSDEVQVFALEDGSTVARLLIPAHSHSMAFEPGTDRIVVSTRGALPLQAWDLSDARQVGTYPQETAGHGDFAFSPDGSTLAVVTDGQVVRLYDASTRRLQLTLPPPDARRGDSIERRQGDTRCFVSDVAFSPDGSTLAVQGCAGVRVFAIGTESLLAIARSDVTRSLTPAECKTYVPNAPCPTR